MKRPISNCASPGASVRPSEPVTAIVAERASVCGKSASGSCPRSARTGAVALGAVYLAFALLGIPVIIAHPLVYNGYGNFFEQLSLATGACIVYASFAPIASIRAARLAWTGYYAFAVCVISFALEQLFYLSATASLVPKWIPPGQTFWAAATSVAFVLAVNYFAVLPGEAGTWDNTFRPFGWPGKASQSSIAGPIPTAVVQERAI